MRYFAAAILTLSATGCGSVGSSATTSTGYLATVAPIFASSCVACHWKGSLTGYQLVDPFDPQTGIIGRQTDWTMARHTTLVVPGKPEESELIDKIKATDLNPETEGASMPFVVPALTADEIAAVRAWIAGGAKNDASYQSTVAPIFGDGKSLGASAGKCSFCHTATSTNAPNLVDPFDASRGAVNVRANVGGVRVIPSDPDHSVLFQKVSGATLPAALGSPMPLHLNPLTASQIATVEAWIQAGAKND